MTDNTENDVPVLLRTIATQLESERATIRELLLVTNLVSSDIDVGIRPGKVLRERLRKAIEKVEGNEG